MQRRDSQIDNSRKFGLLERTNAIVHVLLASNQVDSVIQFADILKRCDYIFKKIPIICRLV